MANRSLTEGNSKRVKVEAESLPRRIIHKTVRLVLLQQVKLTCTGAVTGNVYFWTGAGCVVSVDERDLPHLLSKRVSGSCCSGVISPYFEIVE